MLGTSMFFPRLVHQMFNQCLKADRYESSVYSKTTAPGATSHGTNFYLKEGIPQCSSCWDIRGRQSAIRLLVDDITRYDLATKATLEITGMNREFQEAVIAACLETHRKEMPGRNGPVVRCIHWHLCRGARRLRHRSPSTAEERPRLRRMGLEC